MEKLTKKGLYPAERKPGNIMAQWTGEKRPPLKGEYYLSGSPISAWIAFENLNTPYHIAKLVKVEVVRAYKITDYDEKGVKP